MAASNEKPSKWAVGCFLVGFGLPFLAMAFYIAAVVPRMLVDDASPSPHLEASRELTASVALDQEHPFAVQRFAISTHPDQAQLAATATVESANHAVRLTILSDDGGSISSWTDGRSAGTRVVLGGFAGYSYIYLRPGSYVALLELTGPEPRATQQATLTIDVQAVMSLAGAPSSLDLRLDALGALHTASVTVLRSEYRETIKIGAGRTTRTLALGLAGAALPHSVGGAGHVIMDVYPESLREPDSAYGFAILGRASRPEISVRWDYDARSGSVFRAGGDADIDSGDPSVACANQVGACRIDTTIDLEDRLARPDETEQPSVYADLTFVVVVRDYLLDTATLPDGAELTLDLSSGPSLQGPRP